MPGQKDTLHPINHKPIQCKQNRFLCDTYAMGFPAPVTVVSVACHI